MRSRLLYLEMLAFSLLSLIASFVLSVDAWVLAANPQATFSCDLNAAISCGTVARSWQAQLFGFPNAFLGLIFEPAVIVVAVLGLLGIVFPRRFALAVHGVYSLALIFAYWLFFQSATQIGAVCPWCLLVTIATTFVWTSMWRINIGAGAIKSVRWQRFGKWLFSHGLDYAWIVLLLSLMVATIISKL